MTKHQFLEKHIYQDLTNLNDGFDVPSIYYFSEEDFKIVLDRIEALGLGLYGIEPCFEGEYYDVKVYSFYDLDYSDPKWYRQAFDDMRADKKGLQFAASYHVPKSKLIGNGLMSIFDVFKSR